LDHICGIYTDFFQHSHNWGPISWWIDGFNWIEFSTIFNILVDETPINPSYLDLTHGIPAGAREIGGQTQGFHGQGVSLEDLIVSATLQGLAGFGDLFKRSFGKSQAVTVTKLNYNALFLASKNQICPKSQFRPFWFL